MGIICSCFRGATDEFEIDEGNSNYNQQYSSGFRNSFISKLAALVEQSRAQPLPLPTTSGPEATNEVVQSNYNVYEVEFDDDEDEESCPTCFEGYTVENPKITTKCSHYYHLSCIYEWMERSTLCPICSRVMEFDE